MGNFEEFEGRSAAEIVDWAIATYGDRFAIGTSFQKEGMVVVDLAAKTGRRFRVFTLDTGRLPVETQHMVAQIREHYGIAVEMVAPNPVEVNRMVSSHGLNLFYDSVESRRMCCDVRKVLPLGRKLRKLDAWATGMRRDQTQTRANIAKVADIDGRLKISPLADWTIEQVEAYTLEHGVPVHPLYALGYTSIGCEPCTRALEAGEDPRAGRWWWEQDGKKECGIHFTPDGAIRRVAS